MDMIREWWDWLRRKDLEAAADSHKERKLPAVAPSDDPDNVVMLHSGVDFREQNDE